MAFADEIHVFYEASDLLHYSIAPVILDVSDSYVFRIKDKSELEGKTSSYGEALASHQIYNDSSAEKSLWEKGELEAYLDKLDAAFKEDFGYTFRNMLNFCDVLATWPNFYKTTEVSDLYSADEGTIIDMCNQHLKNATSAEITKIIQSLTLDQSHMLSILGDKNESQDLPVWEINKRPNRYIVKSLIKIGNNIFWGPYSVDKTQKIWLSRVMSGDMPFDLQKPKVFAVIEKRKQDIECKIVEHIFDHMKQFTSCIEKELYLHKRAKGSGYPEDLGDFDVIAFWSEHNVLLNIECKDLTGGYCPKDSKRLRERLFGNKKGDGYIARVEYRQTYLKNNFGKIFKTLNWPSPGEHVNIVSLFVSRGHYYWYLFPPYETDVHFVKVSMLKDFLDKLIGKKQ